SGKPLSACPPSLWSSVAQLVRAHRVAFMFGATLTIILVGSCAALGLMAARLDREKQAAIALTEQERSARKGRELTYEVLRRIPASPSVPGAGGPDVRYRDILDSASREVDAALGARPREAGDITLALGTAYYALGLYQDAQRLGERVLAYARRNPGRENRDL